MPPLEDLPPTEALEIDNGLALVPRVKLTLTIYPVVPSVSKPIDEWQLKRALIDFLKTSFVPAVTVPEEDIVVRRHKDLKKRKREEPVANGLLFVRELGFLKRKKKTASGDGGEDVVGLEKKFLEWRKRLVEKMDDIELNLEGVKYKLSVTLPVSEDFERLKKDWEEFYAFGNSGYSRDGRREPDTIIVRGVPSRWFAEPRVSSKPSMLVTHTIFSTFGKIRNLNVAEDGDLGKDAEEDNGDLASGLHCKIVVQFENYRDFLNTIKAFCGRSMQKEGSRLKADYEVTWDRDNYFRNSRNQTVEKSDPGDSRYRSEAFRRKPFFSDHNVDDTRRKRFRD
ncbi:PREDICTED: uncharacterized protein LOC104816754 [Tarenaya hassleriana]|uniref:uncharacterized protein LOC104816754 n=1 Tax=Tarenaya hassleriana TaxID=28532 RepID=UPI00053CA96E|nr:PREDICTED: uncharacterized protein LOC104816754 [Tarenaya hassleriana]